MTTYYQYHPSYLDWIGVSTESIGYATSEYTPVSVGAGLTQTWTGSGWSTTTDYRNNFYYTTDAYDSIGELFAWVNPLEPPTLAIATLTAPPTISTTGYSLGWDGTDWIIQAANDLTVDSDALIPDGDGVVSLGSSTNKFKDIYVSEGTVYLGIHSLSISTNKLEYDGEQVVTGLGGTINTDFADITNINAGVVTATQIGSPSAGTLNLDGDLIPKHNREQDLGHATKSYRKVYVKSGPKAIEFEDSGVGLGYTVNAQSERLLIFDGHELFFGDGDIGHHGNLNNVYATGIVSASSFNGDGSNLTNVSSEIVASDSTTEAGTKYITFVRSNSTGVGQTVYTNTDLKYDADTNQLTLGGELLASSVKISTLYSVGSNSTVAIAASLVPSADDTYDLGSVGNRWKDLFLDAGDSVLNIGDVGIGVSNGHLVVDGREALDSDAQGDIGTQGRLRNINLTGIITGYNVGIVTYYGDGTNLDLPVTSAGGGAIALKYKSSSSSTMDDPGSGKWRLNNLTQKNATQMTVDVKTSGGYNVNALLSQITVGTKIFIQRKDTPEAYLTFIVNTAPSLNGTSSDGYYLFPSITNLRDGGTGISDNKDCILAFKAPNQVDGEDITPAKVALKGGPSWTNGTGTPEGVVTASVGSLFSRTDGGAGTTLYVKESGTGNTGWVAK